MNADNESDDRASNTAFETLLETDKNYYRAVSRILVRIALAKGLPSSESERVVGESWLDAHLHRFEFPDDKTKQCVLCWLKTTVRRKAENARRRLSKHPSQTLTNSDEELIDSAEAQHAETAERREYLEALFAKVPPAHKQNLLLLRLHFLEGNSIQELAQRFAMTPDAVESRIRRETQELHALAEKYCSSLGDPPFGRGLARRGKKN